jgi:uncharacterized protein YecE (DUF72 family)
LVAVERKRSGMSNLHLGTIGWSYSFWKSNFYPKKTESKEFLSYYSTKFNTVEIDNTFYRIPTPQTVINWKQQVPDGFLFSLKFPQVITHIRRLRDCQRETAVFLERAALLGDKLGCLLLQFPPTFGEAALPQLKSFLRDLPKNHRYAVEVRNKNLLNNNLYLLLREFNVALTWAENPKMPQVEELTSNFIYMRWEGDRKKVNGLQGKIEMDREVDLRDLAEKIKPYLDAKTPVFGYFGKFYSGFPPSDAAYLNNLLAQ